MNFEVKQETFDGPLHVLLELIESRELPITEVSLAQVAEAYLAHIEEHEPPPEELADFLVVATKLLLIKSRAILPVEVEEEEEDPSTLALQLRIYKEFVEVSKKLEALFEAPNESFARPKADTIKSEGIVVADTLTTDTLHKTFTKMLKKLEPFFKLQQSAIERVVSVKERLQEIHGAILARAKLSFKELAAKGASKVDVVVSFLALLELVKQRTVTVVQSGSFDDIEIHRVD